MLQSSVPIERERETETETETESERQTDRERASQKRESEESQESRETKTERQRGTEAEAQRWTETEKTFETNVRSHDVCVNGRLVEVMERLPTPADDLSFNWGAILDAAPTSCGPVTFNRPSDYSKKLPGCDLLQAADCTRFRCIARQ